MYNTENSRMSRPQIAQRGNTAEVPRWKLEIAAIATPISSRRTKPADARFGGSPQPLLDQRVHSRTCTRVNAPFSTLVPIASRLL